MNIPRNRCDSQHEYILTHVALLIGTQFVFSLSYFLSVYFPHFSILYWPNYTFTIHTGIFLIAVIEENMF